MKSLDKKQKKELIQKNLDLLKVTETTYVANTFFVKANEKFETEFMKNLPNAMNVYLTESGLNPSEYSRSLTYSIVNKNNDFTITF